MLRQGKSIPRPVYIEWQFQKVLQFPSWRIKISNSPKTFVFHFPIRHNRSEAIPIEFGGQTQNAKSPNTVVYPYLIHTEEIKMRNRWTLLYIFEKQKPIRGICAYIIIAGERASRVLKNIMRDSKQGPFTSREVAFLLVDNGVQIRSGNTLSMLE